LLVLLVDIKDQESALVRACWDHPVLIRGHDAPHIRIDRVGINSLALDRQAGFRDQALEDALALLVPSPEGLVEEDQDLVR
jgi:hypothetical protein